MIIINIDFVHSLSNIIILIINHFCFVHCRKDIALKFENKMNTNTSKSP